MDALPQLDDQQKEILAQFQAVTRLEDLATAIDCLTRYNWNLQESIQSVFDMNDTNDAVRKEPEQQVAPGITMPSAAPPPSTTSHPFSENNARLADDHEQRQPRRQQNPTFFGLLVWPVHLAWGMIWRILSITARVLGRPAIMTPSSSVRRDPTTLAERFTREFELKYGETHIEFFRGGYSQALETARRELRFLVVVLQCDDHDDTEAFCRETLVSAELIRCVTEHNMLVWGGNVRETEAFNVASTLQATTYPFMAVIALQQAAGSTVMKMAMVERIEGLVTAGRVIHRLETVIQRYSASMNRLLLEREQREMERRLRQEQDQAYRDSLKADQAKERQAREAREAAARAEEEAKRAVQERLELAEKRKQHVRYLCRTLEDEPDATSTDNIARLSFRLADGDRVIRKFRGDAPLESMYKFVEAYPLLKSGEDVTDAEAPVEYSHKYQFTIISPFPRMIYDPSSSRTIAEEKSLWPSATLIVDVDDEEEA